MAVDALKQAVQSNCVWKRAELPLTIGIFRDWDIPNTKESRPSDVRPKCNKLQKQEENPRLPAATIDLYVKQM
jgi:hypothetical protein